MLIYDPNCYAVRRKTPQFRSRYRDPNYINVHLSFRLVSTQVHTHGRVPFPPTEKCQQCSHSLDHTRPMHRNKTQQYTQRYTSTCTALESVSSLSYSVRFGVGHGVAHTGLCLPSPLGTLRSEHPSVREGTESKTWTKGGNHPPVVGHTAPWNMHVHRLL